MQLNHKQQIAFDLVLKGENCFISGPGGVGKSFLTRKIVDSFPDSTVVLAPTGIAALNIGGATIHSAFKFPFSIMGKQHYARINPKAAELFDKDGPVRRIIIDEVSMVRQDVFTLINEQLKRIRRISKPFGGIQVIVVGDFFQLPPVVTSKEESAYYKFYDSQFAFAGETWSTGEFHYIELDQVMRQTDETFINHLQMIRKKSKGYESSVNFFNSIGKRNFSSVMDKDPVYLCTVNYKADSINNEHYDLIDSEEKVFYGEVTGVFKDRPSPECLSLKYGCKVMFTANTESFKNGEIGYVTGFLGDKIEVTLESSEQTLFVERYTWEDCEYDVVGDKLYRVKKGSYTQYPLKLAWACTIHKSQGLTLDNAIIDLGRGAFASGQLYVALSRIKTLDGFGLASPIECKDVIVDKSIIDFYNGGCRGIGL